MEKIRTELSFKMLLYETILRLVKISFAMTLFVITSCSYAPISENSNYVEAEKLTATDVKLCPGDEVEIKFAYTPEFNELQRIRNDGKIELLLVGEIIAIGKSPKELRNELIALYSKHLSHPELAVMLRTSYKNKVYVGGAVQSPGVVPLDGEKTVLQAITEVGGFELDSAKINNVLLIRTADNKKTIYRINIKKYLKENDQKQVYLEEMDVIYVPRTKITNIYSYMEKIWAIIPFRISASYVFDEEDVDSLFR